MESLGILKECEGKAYSCSQLFHAAALGAHRSISTLSVGVKLNSRTSCEAGTDLDIFICLVLAPVGPLAAEIQPDKGTEGEGAEC